MIDYETFLRLRQLHDEQVSVTFGGIRCGEHLLDQTAANRSADEVRPLSQKASGSPAVRGPQQFRYRGHPSGSRGQRSRQAASPEGALTSAGRAARATSTSAVNAAGSLTAISARFLRSTSTPAALRPWTNRL